MLSQLAMLAALLFCTPALGVPALDVATQLRNKTLSHQNAWPQGAILFAAAPFGSPPQHGLPTQHGSLLQPDRPTQLDVLLLAETLLAAPLAAMEFDSPPQLGSSPQFGSLSQLDGLTQLNELPLAEASLAALLLYAPTLATTHGAER